MSGNVEGTVSLFLLLALVLFAIAFGVQLLIDGGALWGGGPIWGSNSPFGPIARYLYLPLVLGFFCGPAALAAWMTLTFAHRFYSRRAAKTPAALTWVVISLAVVTAYLGVVVAFNRWGT